ncbi:Glutathione synthetase [Oopsacas minuta]|uniref:Glutathione synthetase n=1 Tax=Oopsacas minuta TaxID=111878 RepID=A0AAV7KJW0_9METZ|nr:Glutathione synthetase [Oopsacas minuta]
MSSLDLSLFPDGPASVYRMGHTMLAREGVLFLDPAAPVGESQRQIPCTLFPSPLSSTHYKSVLDMQPMINTLYRRVSRDYMFLESTLQSVLGDEFIKRLWEICVHTQAARNTRSAVGLLRSDYMLHCSGHECSMKQVEVNTISVSLATMSQRVQIAHKHISAVFKRTPAPPLNQAAERTADLLALANLEYIHTVPEAQTTSILIVVTENDTNFYDQNYMMALLQSEQHLPVIRKDLEELVRCMRVVDRRIFIGDTEISVCYYRIGYDPSHYSEDVWRVRAMLEGSKALQIPDVAMQLCGTKRMQQRLTDPETLDKFLWDSSKEERNKLMNLFAKQFSLCNSPEGDQMAKDGITHPDLWVLKPQREGGGNNYFGQELVDMLKRLEGKEERGAYILMERLRAPLTPNYLISPRHNKDCLELTNTIQEIGVFGFYIARGDKLSHDVTAGYLVRSKGAQTEDGGVSSGRAYMDSLDLVD